VKKRLSSTEVTLEQGDITKHVADGIVNAANSGLLGGGGVDGAIHRAGGPDILAACKRIREESGKCPPGEAVITTAGNLPSSKVIHTVGPIWHGGTQGEPETLASCYKNSLALAVSNHLKTVAFPSISTGVYGYPVDRAAEVAVQAVADFVQANAGKLERITWVLFDSATFGAYEAALSNF
jgi:O-acetyl-ADP-ribose deacetylase (regulator of RNase III)